METDLASAPMDIRDLVASMPKETIPPLWKHPILLMLVLWRVVAKATPQLKHLLVLSNAKTMAHVWRVNRIKATSFAFGPIPAPRNTARATTRGMVRTVKFHVSGAVTITTAFTGAPANKRRWMDKPCTTAIAAKLNPKRPVTRDATVSTRRRNFAPRKPCRMGTSFAPTRERCVGCGLLLCCVFALLHAIASLVVSVLSLL